MAEENMNIHLFVEVNGDEGRQDESFDIPAIAEISEPKGIFEKSTRIPLALEGDEGRPNESFNIPANIEVNEPESCNGQVIVNMNTTKIRPRIFSSYLSPRTGSCHDICKYGTKHSLEGNPASSVLRKTKSVGGYDRDLRRILVKQNKNAISLKSSSPEMVTPFPTRLFPSIKEVQAAVVPCRQTKLNLSVSKASSFAGQGSSQTKRNKKVQKGNKQDGDGSSSSCTNSTSRRQEINISAEEDIKALVPQAVSWTPRNRGRHGLKNQLPPMKVKLKPGPSNDEVIEEKTLYMIEPSTKIDREELAHPQNSVLTTELSRPVSSSETDNSLKREQVADETPIVPPLLVKLNKRPDRDGTSFKNSSTSSPKPKRFTGLRPRRFSMVQSSDTRSAPSSPLLSRRLSMIVHGEHSGHTSGHDVKKSEKSKVEHMMKTQKMTRTDSENKDCQSRNLKFRKERLVEVQDETITPRRLKFRRIRLLDETRSPKSDSRKRIIQHKDANQNIDEVKEAENNFLRQQDQETKRKKALRKMETINGKLVSSKSKSVKIVLGHQESKGKKEIQHLFDNVIEETTSKLAQNGKSEVKTLVGAFKTVISLQDARHATTIVHSISCSFHI